MIQLADPAPSPVPDPAPGPYPRHTDLRTRTGSRDYAERMLLRAALLAPGDRELIDMVWGEGRSAESVACLLGVPVRRVRTRLRSLGDRMMSRRFVGVMRGRDAWPDRRRRVATLVVLEGETLRATSARLGITLHQVRTEMAIIEGLVR